MKKAKPLLTPEQCARGVEQIHGKEAGAWCGEKPQGRQGVLAGNKAKQGVVTTESGLQYFVMKPGTGKTPLETDVVKVHYTGMLLDGKAFETTTGKDAAEIPVNRVIPGWTEALLKMKVGDKWRLYIPSELAYGAQGPPGGPIPPFATLIFDIELVEIVQ